MPKKLSKKNYRRKSKTINTSNKSIKKIKGGGPDWGSGKSNNNNEKKNKTQSGGGWGRARTGPVIYDASPKMDIKKNFMKKYLKKYFR